MSDQTLSTDKPVESQDEQLSLLTMDDRVKREVAETFGRHALVTETGSTDLVAVADLIYPAVSEAVVETPGERAKVGITPTRLMEQFFTDVPGPSEWAEYEDEDEKAFREAVYERIKAEVFRVLSVNPDGLVQTRLGSNGGMVLCVMPPKGGRERVAYVTRNRKCIDEDNNTPAMRKAQRAADKAAALTALSIDRIPEHARWFASQHKAGLKELEATTTNKVRAALETSTGDGDTSVDE